MIGSAASRMRLRGLLRKEYLQIRRDPSSILLALVMPLLLLFLFGYGVSLNPQEVPVALVVQDHGPATSDLVARFRLSRYFTPTMVDSLDAASRLIDDGTVDGFIQIRHDFSSSLQQQDSAPVQVIVNGIDANRARLILGYARGVMKTWRDVRLARGESMAIRGIQIDSQVRFNQASESRNFLVPGLIALIMTLIGTLLTALVIAREWERGTMEAILVTPLTLNELLIGKILPYYLLGILGLLICVGGGIWIFAVPLRGSLWLLFLFSSLFLLASLGFGLAISATVKIQFVAAQIALVAGFLPAFFLSGMLFDLESTPAFIQWVSHVIPARYFVEISHTLFLAGDIGAILFPAGSALAAMAGVLLLIARRRLSKRLE